MFNGGIKLIGKPKIYVLEERFLKVRYEIKMNRPLNFNQEAIEKFILLEIELSELSKRHMKVILPFDWICIKSSNGITFMDEEGRVRILFKGKEFFFATRLGFILAPVPNEYFLEETIVHGKQIGRQIGFKTANLIYPDNLISVGRGVYKVLVEYNGETYKGIANYGLRPTVSHNEKCELEVHILDFDKEIYGEKIKVRFLKKIRDEQRFDSLDELKEQIKLDILAAQ